MSSSTPTVILVAAAPTLQRSGLLLALRDMPIALQLHTTPNAQTLPAQVQREAPDLLILEASLPGPPLTDLLSQIWQAQPGQRVLVLGSQHLSLSVCRYLAAQGAGILFARQLTPADVVRAVERQLQPRSTVCQGLPSAQPVRPTPPSQPVLTRRELEVLQLVAKDRSTTEIADLLCISIRTVDAHRRMLLEKTGVRSAVGLVLHALQQGWVELA